MNENNEYGQVFTKSRGGEQMEVDFANFYEKVSSPAMHQQRLTVAF